MKLNSFYNPPLKSGTYQVTATNEITPPEGLPITLENNSKPQAFSVIIPHFAIPAGSFHRAEEDARTLGDGREQHLGCARADRRWVSWFSPRVMRSRTACTASIWAPTTI